MKEVKHYVGKNNREKLYDRCKIDWTKFYIEFDDLLNDTPLEFEIMPEDYLKFAKTNLKEYSIQNCIDAMSNAKRAIECQIDLLIKTLGYNYKTFDNRNSYKKVKEFINRNYQGEEYNGIIPRLKLLNILGLAPTLIISSIRNIRNKVEHEYIAPPLEETKKAIEIAELFINSSNRKLSYSFRLVMISNNINKNCRLFSDNQYVSPCIVLKFCIHHSTDTASITLYENNEKYEEIKLKPEDEMYIEIIQCLLSEDYTLLPIIFGCNIEKRLINPLALS